MPTSEQIEYVRAQMLDPRMEFVIWELASDCSKVARVLPELPTGSVDDYTNAIYALIEEGYAEIVRGSFVRRVKVDATTGNGGNETKHAKGQDASTQMGFDFGD